MYQELKPSCKLHNVIDSFWICSTDCAEENFKVLPDACTDLIFDLKQNKAFFSGVMTNFQMRSLAANADLIGVRFKAEKVSCLAQVPLNETKNLRPELSQVMPFNSRQILAQLNNCKTLSNKAHFLENAIAQLLNANLEHRDKLVLSVAADIRLQNGNISSSELAKQANISLRQLERRFKRAVGLTVKEFSSLIRFNKAKKAIEHHKSTSLLAIAFDTGFFDHAHMNHEFNRIAGENPCFFR